MIEQYVLLMLTAYVVLTVVFISARMLIIYNDYMTQLIIITELGLDEYCMCGDKMGGHFGYNHSPVSIRDYQLSQLKLEYDL